MNILVAGGAGYIGSHMCKVLFHSGHQPIVLDNLIRGHRKAVKWGAFIEGSLEDAALLEHIFSNYDIAAVMHFAAFIEVGESVQDPAKYYQNNVAATLTLLRSMIKAGIPHFIFSSSAAVYGNPAKDLIDENHRLQPINPYGRSKLMVEQILNDFQTAYGLHSISLRYFNAAGADPDGQLGEDHHPETHLIPLVLKAAAGLQKDIKIFGDDYPTRDGTCIRDYIHVLDLAQAHLLALQRLCNGGDSGVYNLGNGTGYSVKAVLEAAGKIAGKPVPFEIVGRRQGDPAVLVSASKKAKAELGWEPQYSELEVMIRHAWNWHRKYPQGFGQ
jgi:UDP-glucose-4-epimerase GalE